MIMTKEELSTIIKNHQHWLNQDCEGWEKMKANLRGAYLIDADLRGVDLRYADLENAILDYANLYAANLTGANLTNANLIFASLIFTNLENTNLTGVDFKSANLYGANLAKANLTSANLIYANLANANLVGANLEEVNGDYANFIATIGIDSNRKGKVLTTDLVGYKKCSIGYNDDKRCENGIIVKLLIPRGAIVFSINDKKCRTNKVKVLEIEGADRAYSWYSGMSYYVGDEITIYDFDCRYNIECAEGIHFFKNREDAINF